MQIKVKYEETTTRESTVTVDDQEFLNWYNEAFDPDERATDPDDIPDRDVILQEYLEDGDESEWATARDHDPFAEVYDKNILKVSVED